MFYLEVPNELIWQVNNHKISYGWCTNIKESGNVDAPNFDDIVKHDLDHCTC